MAGEDTKIQKYKNTKIQKIPETKKPGLAGLAGRPAGRPGGRAAWHGGGFFGNSLLVAFCFSCSVVVLFPFCLVLVVTMVVEGFGLGLLAVSVYLLYVARGYQQGGVVAEAAATFVCWIRRGCWCCRSSSQIIERQPQQR